LTITALREQNWSVFLREFARLSGFTQEQIHQATGLKQPTISRLMSGAVKAPAVKTLRLLCEGLRVPPELSGIGWGVRTPAVPPRGGEETSFPEVEPGDASVRQFEPFELMPDQAPGLDPEVTLRNLQDTRPKLLALNDELGGDLALCRSASQLVGEAEMLVQHGRLSAELTHQSRLLAEQLAMYSGWLFYDANNQQRALSYWRHALWGAQLAGHSLMEVYALESLSLQAAAFLNRPMDAIQLAQRAMTISRGNESLHLRSLLLMRESVGWAARGDASQAENLYERAKSAYLDPAAATESNPDWLNFYTLAEIEGLRAFSLMLLNDNTKAQKLLRRTITGVGSEFHRNHLYYIAALGRVTTKVGDIKEAIDIVEPHLEEYTKTGSTRAVNHLRVVVDAASKERSSRARAFANDAQELKLWH